MFGLNIEQIVWLVQHILAREIWTKYVGRRLGDAMASSYSKNDRELVWKLRNDHKIDYHIDLYAAICSICQEFRLPTDQTKLVLERIFNNLPVS